MKKTHSIFLAAGIFYPDVGGPAIHVKNIAERLVTEGFKVTVLAYGDDMQNTQFSFAVKRISRTFPKVVQWILYILHAIRLSASSDLVYAFDPTSAGLPACVSAKIFNKPFFIRVGGDPIWERDAEAGRVFMTLDEYYIQGRYRVGFRKILFYVIRYILQGADVVVLYNNNFKQFYITYYNVDSSHIHVIKNPVFKRVSGGVVLSENPIVLFAGRFVKYKNLEMLMVCFNAVRKMTQKGTLVLIGKGPYKEVLLELQKKLEHGDQIEFIDSLPQPELFIKIQEASLAIGPALSEFNPNFILEALSFGKPVLLSKGHGLSVDLDDRFTFDPNNGDELIEKLAYFFNPQNYINAAEYVQSLPLTQTWDAVTGDHVVLIHKYLG